MTISKVEIMTLTTSLVKVVFKVTFPNASTGFYKEGREGTNNMSTTTVQREGMESHTLQSC